jgi:hypothetical protein
LRIVKRGSPIWLYPAKTKVLLGLWARNGARR